MNPPRMWKPRKPNAHKMSKITAIVVSIEYERSVSE